MRKELALFAAIAAVFTFVTFSAQAMPAASLKGVTNSDQTITQVRGGCGHGWHRGPRGHCRRN
jgi:Spy/CpxP family protein refolding chaperone